jgi:hypothetical protein
VAIIHAQERACIDSVRTRSCQLCRPNSVQYAAVFGTPQLPSLALGRAFAQAVALRLSISLNNILAYGWPANVVAIFSCSGPFTSPLGGVSSAAVEHRRGRSRAERLRHRLKPAGSRGPWAPIYHGRLVNRSKGCESFFHRGWGTKGATASRKRGSNVTGCRSPYTSRESSS